jgi:hypothetical protein
MSSANVESVQRIYEAFGAGDVDAILHQVPAFFQAIGETIDDTALVAERLAS